METDVQSPRGSGDEVVIDVSRVSKSFPGVLALSDVSIRLAKGEIHGLVGENGAGKSTLVNIIAGIHQADSGAIAIRGEHIEHYDNRIASRMGVSVVHQERSLSPNLTVAENIFGGSPPTHFRWIVDRRTRDRKVVELLQLLNANIAPNTLAGELSSAEQQLVEIAKGLSRETRLLVLDEPTAALTVTETEQLFAVVRTLAAQGVAVLYISHRLHEIFELADRVTVLRDGKVTATKSVGEVDEQSLIRFMIGRELHEVRHRRVPKTSANPLLVVEHLKSSPHVKDVTFSVNPGEIVCLAGLIGAGRSEVCETIFGFRSRHGGVVSIDGVPHAQMSPNKAMALGVGFVPEDRKDGGLFLNLSVRSNMMSTNIESVARHGIVRADLADDLALRFVDELHIVTPDVHQLVGNLSGGNQQKVLLAKWLARQPRLLMVDEPTRGVDVGAREDIYRILRELADNGTAVLAVSSELPEVLAIADRIVVLAEGVSTGELTGETTEEEILALATPRINEGGR